MPEFDLNRDTVQKVVDLAHEFHAQDDVTFDEEPAAPDEFWSRQMSEDFSRDAYYGALKSSINDLEPDQQVSLVALMWLGRGDFSLDEWQDALAHAEGSWNEHTADYLIGTALLADYLEEGLQKIDSTDSE